MVYSLYMFQGHEDLPSSLFTSSNAYHPATKVEFIYCSLSSLSSSSSEESLGRKLLVWSVSLDCLYVTRDWGHLLFVLLPLSCFTYENSQEIHLYHNAGHSSYRCESLWHLLYSTIWCWASQWSQILTMFTVLPWTWVCIYLPEIKSSCSLNRSLGI